MAAQATAVVESSRPSIEVDGRRDAGLCAGLMAMDIIETSEGLARAELVFGNWGGGDRGGFQYFDRRLLDFGKALSVKVGDDLVFKGAISAISAQFPEGRTPQLGVCAEDRLQDLRMTRRTRSFADATLADVLKRIASEHGLQAQTDLTGETYKHLAQVNQSDLAFVRDLARREDAQIWIDDMKLKAAQRARRDAPTVELSWAGELREFHVCADLAHQRTKLVGSGWSVADKRVARHEADEAAIRAELNGNPSGARTLQRAFGERIDTLAHALPAVDAEARAFAEASFRHMARRFVVGHGVAKTKAGLRVGAKLKLKGIGPMFEGDYTVTEVRVRFDANKGLRTEFWCDRPAIGQGR
ncbi:contractile injection system protein, VgrG/Pvc8 family [Cupriavidus necator]|uniref:phage late control D family protein n=1 Tax=Cupriavidus necator TaxID=106590 RepID=UPI0039C0764A